MEAASPPAQCQWVPFRCMEDLPPSLQPQPALAYNWCWQCIRSYGLRYNDPRHAQSPNSAACDLSARQPCWRCREKNFQDCGSAEAHVPAPFHRAVNILCALRSVGDGMFRAQGRKHAIEVRAEFYCKFAKYGHAILKAIFAWQKEREDFVAKFGELMLLREDRKEFRLYLHNFERIQLGLGETGNPKPANIVVDAEVEADFLANASEAEMRRIYYGTSSFMPIRMIEQRHQAESSVQVNGARVRSGP